MKSEQAIDSATLRQLVRDLYARAQAFGRAGDWDKAWSAAEAADGLAKQLEAVS